MRLLLKGNVSKLKNMIDLKALDREIDELLESKSDEDLLNWLESYNNKNIESYIGEGQFYKMEVYDPNDFEMPVKTCSFYMPKDNGSGCIDEDHSGNLNEAA